jgi:glutamate N-acetyltransferase/amino-acid N-acetyltransferase
MPILTYPKGFYSLTKNIGIKDTSLDFAIIFSEKICNSACVFTLNNFPGAPILVGKKHSANGKLQAIVINSKNANVATGEKGVQDCISICERIAQELEIPTESILPSSTGVIGVPLPIEKIINACKNIKSELKLGLDTVATAIMTTDTVEKISFREIKTDKGTGILYGIAKGAGMIEPNMATMLSYILTDIEIEENLQTILKEVVDQSFNCLTIDSDTSTSDTVALLSNGLAGKAELGEFKNALLEICIELTKKIARDGEGATKLITLEILEARDQIQSKKIGKSILNSPLVKTAIYGGDPNWGRFVMAIGKVFEEKIEFESLRIKIGGIEVKNANEETKQKLSKYLKENENIQIQIYLGQGVFKQTFWSCDFTEGYIKENAYYTT